MSELTDELFRSAEQWGVSPESNPDELIGEQHMAWRCLQAATNILALEAVKEQAIKVLATCDSFATNVEREGLRKALEASDDNMRDL